jgi:hypothetical protein
MKSRVVESIARFGVADPDPADRSIETTIG